MAFAIMLCIMSKNEKKQAKKPQRHKKFLPPQK